MKIFINILIILGVLLVIGFAIYEVKEMIINLFRMNWFGIYY